jgi:hypothetical protein
MYQIRKNTMQIPLIGSVIGKSIDYFKERGIAKTAEKQAKIRYASQVADNNFQLKIAYIKGLIEKTQRADNADIDYDLQAQINKKFTIADEILVTVFIVIFIAGFIPGMADYIMAGWQAHSQAPPFFHITMTIIVVSTFGGIRILKLILTSVTGGASSLFNAAKKIKSKPQLPDLNSISDPFNIKLPKDLL